MLMFTVTAIQASEGQVYSCRSWKCKTRSGAKMRRTHNNKWKLKKENCQRTNSGRPPTRNYIWRQGRSLNSSWIEVFCVHSYITDYCTDPIQNDNLLLPLNPAGFNNQYVLRGYVRVDHGDIAETSKKKMLDVYVNRSALQAQTKPNQFTQFW